MNPAEKEVLDYLALAVNKFASLKRYHPQEMDDFVSAMHAVQVIVMARAAVRSNPDYFTHMGDL